MRQRWYTLAEIDGPAGDHVSRPAPLPEFLTLVMSAHLTSGLTSTVPAPEAYTELDVIEIKGSQGKKFHLNFDLWVDGEPSDLTLSCGVTVLDSADVKLEMNNVHVL
jgi:hypothetical protein